MRRELQHYLIQRGALALVLLLIELALFSHIRQTVCGPVDLQARAQVSQVCCWDKGSHAPQMLHP